MDMLCGFEGKMLKNRKVIKNELEDYGPQNHLTLLSSAHIKNREYHFSEIKKTTQPSFFFYRYNTLYINHHVNVN